MIYTHKTSLIIALAGLFFSFLTINTAVANDEKEKIFSPGQFIIDHVVDSYGWHITTIGEREISIPLPVILFDKGKPVVFMSGNFHHGHAAYNGYALGFTPETKGKIVRITHEDGTPYCGELQQSENYLLDNKGLFDVSITKNVCSLWISIILIITIFLTVAKQYKKRARQAPKGLQSFLEPLILFIRDEVAIPSLGQKHYAKYFPYLLTLFFFILINNLMGLIPLFPGGANLTGNIVVTGILALITFLIVSFSSNKHYWLHIFNMPGAPWWLKIPLPLMPVVELMGVFTKPFVLMVRLFANMTAGHVIILGVISLIFIFGKITAWLGLALSPVSLLFYLFMGALEVVVAFIQAFVFVLLTAIYIGSAMENAHTHSEESITEIK